MRPIPTIVAEITDALAELTTTYETVATALGTPTTQIRTSGRGGARNFRGNPKKPEDGITIRAGVIGAFSSGKSLTQIEVARIIRGHPNYKGAKRKILRSVSPAISTLKKEGFLIRLPNGQYQKA